MTNSSSNPPSSQPSGPIGDLNVQDADSTVRVFEQAAEANYDASCRQRSIDVIEAPGKLIATGDLHDNPVHLQRLAEAAGLLDDAESQTHITFHEIIHSDRLIQGADLSYRALARVAAMKAAHPERVHTLLANHELAQVVGSGIVKNGVRCVDAFNAGVEYVFGSEASRVDEAIQAFIRSMPIALRCQGSRRDVLCSHSLPGPAQMQRFDATILDRDLTPEDFQPLTGSGHMMVWGRGYDAEQLEDLVERWGVSLFLVGHEHADDGIAVVPPCGVVLNSDHERGVYLPIDLAEPIAASEAPLHAVSLSAIGDD